MSGDVPFELIARSSLTFTWTTIGILGLCRNYINLATYKNYKNLAKYETKETW